MKLADIRTLCDAATLGPWRWHRDSIVGREIFEDGSGEGTVTIIETDSRVYPPEDNDAAFIIAARTLLPQLLAVAEAAKNPALTWCEDRCNGVEYAELEQAWSTLDDALAELEADGD